MGVLLRLLSAGLHGGFHITSVTMVTTGTGTNGNFGPSNVIILW